MTENKRLFGGRLYSDSEVTGLLNGLTAKNKVLQKEIERLKIQNKDLLYSNAKNRELLEEENEQLKQSNQKAIEFILDGIVEMHDGKRDYAETIFNKAIKLLEGDVE